MFGTDRLNDIIEGIDIPNINSAVVERRAEFILCAFLDAGKVCRGDFVQVEGVYCMELAPRLHGNVREGKSTNCAGLE